MHTDEELGNFNNAIAYTGPIDELAFYPSRNGGDLLIVRTKRRDGRITEIGIAADKRDYGAAIKILLSPTRPKRRPVGLTAGVAQYVGRRITWWYLFSSAPGKDMDELYLHSQEGRFLRIFAADRAKLKLNPFATMPAREWRNIPAEANMRNL